MTCSECDQLVVARGFCGKHYQRWWKQASPSEMRRQVRRSRDESYFDVIDTPEKAYWLGFIAADGCVTGYTLQIRLQAQDESHLLKFATCIGSDAPVTPTVKEMNGKVYHGVGIRVNSKHMTESLARLDITPRKSFTVEPWKGPPDLMAAYWRGLFDGDGGICKVHRKNSDKMTWTLYICGTYACVDGFSQWAREICGSVAQPSKKSTIWQWQVGGTVAPQLLAREFSTAPIGLDRKQELLEELSDTDFGIKILA